MADREELAWAAGFYDGEGCIGPTHKGGRRPCVQLSIHQVERQPLDRFLAAVGRGKVYGPYHHGSGQPIYKYYAGNHEQCQMVIASLWQWMSNPKRQQAHLVLSNLNSQFGTY